MTHRKMPRTGWSVSAIGFGAWGIGGQWGPVAEADAIAVIRQSLDMGVNFFDTADAYGDPPGLTEELLGCALGRDRSDVFIATKVGNFARRQGHPLPYTHPLHIELCCQASLRRLKTETIDLYQCHLGDLKTPDIFLEAFDTLIRKGLIRAFGISTNDPEVVKAFDREGKLAAVQFDYSILNRAPESDILPLCQKRGLGAIVRGPLAQGILSGKFTPQTRFTDSVREKWNSGPQRESFLKGVAVAASLSPLTSPARSCSQLALAYILAHPAVTCPIPGGKNAEQAMSNALAGDIELTPQELATIRAASA